jgi:hypothetical protein
MAAGADREVFLPAEQAQVSFYARPIRAVRLPDGRIAAVFSDLCEAIGLTRPSQARRIQADETLAEHLVLARVETDGGPQSLDVLTAWAIPAWLQGIHLSRVTPEKRAAILAFKREAADVLYRHFSGQAALSAATTDATVLVPSEPVAQPERPAAEAERGEWITYHQAMVAWLQWQDDMERWRAESAERQQALEERQDALENRMEQVEELSRLFLEVRERLGAPALTPEHQAAVRRMAARLCALTGQREAEIAAELRAALHLARTSDGDALSNIPESAWERVAAWFQFKIADVEKSGGG